MFVPCNGRQFEALKVDFTYNLNLLRQRDEELSAYDEASARSQVHEEALRGHVSELEQVIAELQAGGTASLCVCVHGKRGLTKT